MLTVEQLLKTAHRDLRKTQRAYDYNIDKLNCPEEEKQYLKQNLEYRRFVLRLVEAYVRAYDRKQRNNE